MPDTPVAPHEGPPYDCAMEVRVSRLEEDMREVKTAWSRSEASLARIEALLQATLPHLATKADLAELRTETKAEIADLRASTEAGFSNLRTEMKSEIADVKLAIARLDADKPSKAAMWGIMTALLAAYACGLAALAVLK